MNNTRRAALKRVVKAIKRSKSDIQDIIDEEINAFENMSYNLQISSKGEKMQENAEELESTLDTIDEIIDTIENVIYF